MSQLDTGPERCHHPAAVEAEAHTRPDRDAASAAEARVDRLHEAEERIRFRSIRERTGADQLEAVGRGYDSVEQLAIDELGRAYHDLLTRVERLEQELDPERAGG